MLNLNLSRNDKNSSQNDDHHDSGPKSNRDSEIIKYSSSISRQLQPWPASYDEPSDLFRSVNVHSQHPPIIQDKSWNIAVPYKEQRFFHTPSESIANNYTPFANNLKLKDISSLTRTKKFKGNGYYRGGNSFKIKI
jgi:hypothetical protein